MLGHIPHPAIIAHRGSSASAPENTLAAFQLALEQGADGIELDAKLTTDGQVVVIHDQTVDRTTNGKGKVGQLSLDVIRKLDAGRKFSAEYTGEGIPTLEEVFQRFSQKLYINVELTNYSSPGDELPDRVAVLVNEYQCTNRVLFSSFHPKPLIKIHELLPKASIALLTLPGFPGLLANSLIAPFVPHQSINPYYKAIHRDFIEKQHNKNCSVYAWTVNDPDAIRRLFLWNADGIITDDPTLARKIFEESR